MYEEFEHELSRVYEDLLRYSRSLEGSFQNGDDLLQESLIKAWKKFHQLREKESFKFWLLRIIRTTHISRKRSAWFKRVTGFEGTREPSLDPDTAFEEREAVRMALGRMSLPQREAIILYEILEMPVAKIAEIQSTTVSSVKSRLSRGRVNLRKHYEVLTTPEGSHEKQLPQAG